MEKQRHWLNRPYYSIGDYYKERFNERVSKISVTVADTCPNRMGLKGMQTCTFCDVWGSAAYADQRDFSLEDQIKNVHEKIISMGDYKKFVVYFQSYTNSFMGVRKLEAMYEEALKFPNIVGLVIGTRPDCISPAMINLWKKFAERTYVSIELGAQSFYEEFLDFEKRGHTAQDTLDAIYKLAEAPELEIGLHMIFGHPGETVEHAIAQSQFVSNLPIHNVKLHNLHVLKHTILEKYYEKGLFKPMELEDYSKIVAAFIQHLNPKMPIQRLSALSSRWDELIAPSWTKQKMIVFQHIIEHMQSHKMYQGQNFEPKSVDSRLLPDIFKVSIVDQKPFNDYNAQLKAAKQSPTATPPPVEL